MFRTTRFLLFFFCIWALISGLSAQEKYRAAHWGLSDGLTQAENYNILKDLYGFIWVTSKDGLNRFDGNTFRQYFASGNPKYGLIGNDTRNGLVEDSLYNIWIGSDGGISRFDIRADTFTHFRLPMDTANQFQHANPIWATRNEVICVENEKQIVAYNIHTLNKRILGSFEKGDNISIGPSLSYCYFDSLANTIWTLSGGTSEGGPALLARNLSTGQRETYAWPYLSAKNNDHTAEAMKYDKRRNVFWINTRDGLWCFSLSTLKFSQPDLIRKLSLQKNYDRWVGLDLDRDGRIWFATHPQGILIYDPETNILSKPFSQDSILQERLSYANACIYTDRDGMIWSGHWLMVGIDAVIPFSRTVTWYHSFPTADNSPKNLVVPTYIGQNRVLVGGEGQALVELNTITGKIKMIQKKDLKGILSDFGYGFIGALGADTLNFKTWLWTPGGFYEWDLRNDSIKKIRYFDSQHQLVNVNPGGMAHLHHNGIIRICRIGPADFKVFLINSEEPEAHQIFDFKAKDYDLYYTMTDLGHTLFIRGALGGKNLVYREIHHIWVPLKDALADIPWTGIAYSTFDSSYWVAANKMLYHYTYDFRLISKLGKENGVPELVSGGLRIDNEGNLWFHTDRSIHRLNTRIGWAYTLSTQDGFEEQTFETMQFTTIDAQGNIYFAGGVFGKGFNKISPQNLKVAPPLIVYFRNFRIYDQKDSLGLSADTLSEIYLRHNQNTVSIETGIVDLYTSGRSSIRYKLVGIDSNWSYGPYYATIRYDGLPPGDFQLVVQANDGAGQFNGIPHKMGIHISPAFWQTLWFRVALVLMLIGLMYAVIQFRSRNLRNKNIQLEEKVAHRTRELKLSLEDLKETQTQLIQREKMASLGELTAGIAHEIQNPLNFVNNFSEVNKELIDEMDQEIENGNIAELKSIAHNIRENELKINQHGKRADAIVKGMLQHSRTSTGVKEATDINALADEYLRLSYHGLRAKDKSFNSDFETRFDPALREINLIPQDIGRVLLNIYNNAFYAVHEKQKQLGGSFKPKVAVTTQFLPALNRSTPQVEIRIRDNGMGVPKKVIDKIFQPFFTTKPTGEGTGLGLSLSYDIITKTHGGTLKVDTQEGEYTEFIIELPITGI